MENEDLGPLKEGGDVKTAIAKLRESLGGADDGDPGLVKKIKDTAALLIKPDGERLKERDLGCGNGAGSGQTSKAHKRGFGGFLQKQADTMDSPMKSIMDGSWALCSISTVC